MRRLGDIFHGRGACVGSAVWIPQNGISLYLASFVPDPPLAPSWPRGGRMLTS
jgi:hypothetical protein